MNFNTFRRGGLFDPITFGSGEELAKSAGGFFEGFGKPIMSASNPADLKIMADKALSRGDAQSAVLYGQMAQKIEDQYKQQADLRKAQRSALNKMHNENDVLLAEVMGGEKASAANKAQEAIALEGLTKRFGRDDAEILLQLPPDKRGDIVKELMKGRKTDIRTLSDEHGNKWEWVVDKESGEKLQRIGLKEKASKDEVDAAGVDKKRVSYLDTHLTSADNVKTAINKALELSDDFLAAGFGSGVAKRVSGTSAKNLESALNTIKANIGFDRLQQMREESKTGGALGQVAIMELIMLQSVIGSLDQAQSDEQLRENLQLVDKHYNRLISAMEAEKTELLGDEDWAIKEK